MKFKILILFAAISVMLNACGQDIHFVDEADIQNSALGAMLAEEAAVESLPETEPAEEAAAELAETEVIAMAPEETPAATEAEPQEAPTFAEAPAPTASPAVGYAYGAVPFSLSRFANDWWSIDDSDDAYRACGESLNAMRQAAGLGALTVDSGLSAIASSRCEALINAGDFSHAGQCTAGEILGLNYNSASAACSAWQASPSHYAVITGGYSRMGIGCFFEQSGGTLWCVVFE